MGWCAAVTAAAYRLSLSARPAAGSGDKAAITSLIRAKPRTQLTHCVQTLLALRSYTRTHICKRTLVITSKRAELSLSAFVCVHVFPVKCGHFDFGAHHISTMQSKCSRACSLQVFFLNACVCVCRANWLLSDFRWRFIRQCAEHAAESLFCMCEDVCFSYFSEATAHSLDSYLAAFLLNLVVRINNAVFGNSTMVQFVKNRVRQGLN